MIYLQQFNAYLKICWIKRFFSNLKGGWQKIMTKNTKYYGGERLFSLQKENFIEIYKIFSNPFWKDVFSKATCKIEYKGVFLTLYQLMISLFI